ncbi:MAG TPA: helix-turn-helix domain-containing protein [Candidatus Moranbacteria bacterium]|nr:helix-turn-helix domain-containing protein [Candidatus Moranbacteria bacterium]
MLEQELISIGLNEKETKVYLASLELGQSTVQSIAVKAGINRATTYFIIDGLMQRGLITSFNKGKKQYFFAADPERLIEILEREKENIESKKNNLQKLLPQLRSLNNKQSGRPLVRYYEGKEGISSMVEEVFREAKGVVYMAYSADEVGNIFSKKDQERWRKIRVDKNMPVKAIYTKKEGKIGVVPKSESLKIPFEKFPISCDFAVFNDKVRIASLKNRLTGIIIEDKEIASSFRALINLALETAKKYDAEE